MTAAWAADLPFCRFRIPARGKRVIWEVTNACNYGCRYCIFASTTRTPPGELSPEEAAATVDALVEAGFTHVKFTGGEPFLRPDMTDLLERSSGLGLACDVSTNASRIDAAIAARLARLPLEMVHVSLDGPTRRAHEAVRGRGTWEPTLAGLRLLSSSGVRLRIGCVIHLHNEHLLDEMADLCQGLGAQSLALSLMEPVGRMRGRPSLVAQDTPAVLASRADELAQRWRRHIAISHNIPSGDRPSTVDHGCGSCPGGDRFLFIDHRGRVSPCTWVSEHRPDLVAGNLRDQPLADILASEPIAGFRRKALHMRDACACPVDVPDVLAEVEAALQPTGPGRFGVVSRIYPFATENLAYLGALRLPGARVMAVDGSGDHAIEACRAGAAEVLSLDVNRRAAWWSDLKLAALRMMDRWAFLDAGYLDHGGDGAAFREGDAFHLLHDDPAKRLANCGYLRDDDAFERARDAVSNARLGRVTADITAWIASQGTSNVRSGGWDAVLLSNLAEHSHRLFPGSGHEVAFRERVVLPLLRLAAPGGRVVVGYAFASDGRGGAGARNPFGDPAVRRALYGGIAGWAYREVAVPSALGDGGEDAAVVLEHAGGDADA